MPALQPSLWVLRELARREGDMPSYDVLVYRSLETDKSYEVGEPVPELGEGLYVVALTPRCTPAERRPSWSRTKGGAWRRSSVASGCRSSSLH
jgi:hypothetical protein